MISFDVPGVGAYRIEVLLSDFNGTLAVDGRLAPGVSSRLRRLARLVEVVVVTSDTRGTAARALRGLPVRLELTSGKGCREEKLALLQRLRPGRVCALGNGANDEKLLTRAALSLCVLGEEGAAGAALRAADMVVRSPVEALDALLDPVRLVSTLRL